MNKLQLLPDELVLIIISNLDSISKIKLISTSMGFKKYITIRKSEITKQYLYNHCDNICESTKKSIIKNDNNLLNLKYKINLLKKFNECINKRFYDG